MIFRPYIHTYYEHADLTRSPAYIYGKNITVSSIHSDILTELHMKTQLFRDIHTCMHEV